MNFVPSVSEVDLRISTSSVILHFQNSVLFCILNQLLALQNIWKLNSSFFNLLTSVGYCRIFRINRELQENKLLDEVLNLKQKSELQVANFFYEQTVFYLTQALLIPVKYMFRLEKQDITEAAVPFKVSVLKNFVIFTGKHLC